MARSFAGGRLALALSIRPSASFLFVISALLVAAVASFGGVTRADPKRDVPDYDGRGNPDADADSWLRWLPRVVLSPLYAANEHLLRRPLGALVSRAERDRWSDTVAHLFTFGEAGRSVIVPIASFDLGLLPTVGAVYSRDGLIAGGNRLVLQGATWGPRRIDASAADRYAIDRSDSVQQGAGVASVRVTLGTKRGF